jgi:hypothetical protein
MPSEDWIQHCKVAQFLYDWQILIAGLFAAVAAAETIWATTKSANREIGAPAKRRPPLRRSKLKRPSVWNVDAPHARASHFTPGLMPL